MFGDGRGGEVLLVALAGAMASAAMFSALSTRTAALSVDWHGRWRAVCSPLSLPLLRLGRRGRQRLSPGRGDAAPALVTVVDNLPSDWDGYVGRRSPIYSAAATVELKSTRHSRVS